MIKYDPLWKTMKERNITQYDLYTHYNVSRSLLDKFRKNKNVELYTLNTICAILDCNISDIVTYVPDETDPPVPTAPRDQILSKKEE